MKITDFDLDNLVLDNGLVSELNSRILRIKKKELIDIALNYVFKPYNDHIDALFFDNVNGVERRIPFDLPQDVFYTVLDSEYKFLDGGIFRKGSADAVFNLVSGYRYLTIFKDGEDILNSPRSSGSPVR